MAALVLTDVYLAFNSNDLSSYVQSITIDPESAIVESTTMGNTWETNLGGLKSWSATIQFRQDFANSALDSILFPLLGGTYVMTGKSTSGPVSTSNPSYSGSGILKSYTPITGSVGDLAKAPASIQGSGALVRATS